MDELLGIGEFSARCGLSAKMLRSYARAGLLAPVAVDGSSGYRYYSPSQLPEARVVALLRQAGIGVEEIAKFFSQPDSEQLERWDRVLKSEASSRRRALDDARRALGMDRPEPARPEPDSAQRPRGQAKGRSNPAQGPCNPARKEETMTYQFSHGWATERGGRESNEDSAVATKQLWAVADGLGGLGNGDVASRQALEVLAQGFGRDQSIAGILGACRDANHTVFRAGAERSPDSAMGSTLVALALTSDIGAVVVHVGDSRLYRLRNGRLVQLTKDHSVVAELIETGQLDSSEADTHPHRHVLTRALGVSDVVDVDHAGVLCRSGDRFLLCTDGLWQTLSAAELAAYAGADGSPQARAEQLVSAAVEQGAEDNVTALVVSVS